MDASFIQNMIRAKFDTFLKVHLKEKNQTILEVNDGEGSLISKWGPQASYYIVSSTHNQNSKNLKSLLTSPSYHVIVEDRKKASFSAIFDVILVNLAFEFFSNPKESLTQYMGCLKPGGHLYMICLGECSFYEWIYACQRSGIILPPFPFLTQKQTIWTDDSFADIQEEWLQFESSSLVPFLKIFDPFQRNFLKNKVSMSALKQAFHFFQQQSNPYVTLHFIYGKYSKSLNFSEE